MEKPDFVEINNDKKLSTPIDGNFSTSISVKDKKSPIYFISVLIGLSYVIFSLLVLLVSFLLKNDSTSAILDLVIGPFVTPLYFVGFKITLIFELILNNIRIYLGSIYFGAVSTASYILIFLGLFFLVGFLVALIFQKSGVYKKWMIGILTVCYFLYLPIQNASWLKPSSIVELITRPSTVKGSGTTNVNIQYGGGSKEVVGSIKIISPVSDSTLCLGDRVDVGWQADSATSFVNIYIGDVPGGGFLLESLPSSYNEMGIYDHSGVFVWDVGLSLSGDIVPGQYFLTINGKNADFSDNSRTFIPIYIENCDG